MALTAFDRAGERPPISQHRAFPAIVALWFAALLGVGSMVVPVALLERGVALTGIAAFVPAASPPLGLTARVLIALVAAVVGALAGVAIARRVARAHDNESDGDGAWAEARFANGARRPLDVTAELGEGLSAGFGQPVTRRRALAIAEDDRPGDEVYGGPLPDAEAPLPAYDEPPYAPEASFEPHQPVDDAPEAWERPETADPDGDAPTRFVHDVEPLPSEPEARVQQEFAEPQAEPLPFADPSLARREVDAFVPEPDPVEPPRFAAAPEPEPDEPELVQLVHRLKTSLERRREQASAAAPTPVPAVDFEAAPADDAAQAMAAYFGRPAQTLPPAAVAAEEEPEEEDEDVDEFDDSYSSLLAMRGPYTPKGPGRVPINASEPETSPAEPEAPVDTDAALRAALAKLQRMSGAA